MCCRQFNHKYEKQKNSNVHAALLVNRLKKKTSDRKWEWTVNQTHSGLSSLWRINFIRKGNAGQITTDPKKNVSDQLIDIGPSINLIKQALFEFMESFLIITGTFPMGFIKRWVAIWKKKIHWPAIIRHTMLHTHSLYKTDWHFPFSGLFSLKEWKLW